MSDLDKNQVLEIFHKRAPNFLTLDNIAYDLPGIDRNAIQKAVDELCANGVLVKTEGKNKVKDHYALPSYDNIPVKEYMSISGIKVPRVLAYDRPRPEDLNIFFESLARRSASLESEFNKIVEEKLQSYWANIIILFGIFISLFALIVTFVEKVEIESGSSFWGVFALNAAQVLPLALVLAGFVWLLKWLFR
jgi:biotin operon repressor